MSRPREKFGDGPETFGCYTRRRRRFRSRFTEPTEAQRRAWAVTLSARNV